jgi:hypothetical protein
MAAKPEKLSLEQLLRLVDQLPAEQQEELRVKLNRMAKSPTSSVAEPHPFLDHHINIDSLAKQQGVPEQTSVESLKGGFWPADEDLDEFVTTLRQWRKESSGQK